MPQEEKPTILELDNAHACGFRPFPFLHRMPHYVRVMRSRASGRVTIDFLPAELLKLAKPAPSGSTVRAWWSDELYATRLRYLFGSCGSLDEAHRFRSAKGKFKQEF